MAQERVKLYSPHAIKQWFVDHRQFRKIPKIKKAKRVWNMDESGARVCCLSSQTIIVSKEIKELCTFPLENRLLNLVIEKINATGFY